MMLLTLSFVLLGLRVSSSTAWVLVPQNVRSFQGSLAPLWQSVDAEEIESFWGEDDDWSKLSTQDQQRHSEKMYHDLIAGNGVFDAIQEIAQGEVDLSADDQWISSVVDEVHNNNFFATIEGSGDDNGNGSDEGNTYLYDTSFEETQSINEIDEMSNEIAMLVRCNQRPQDLLIAEGRAFAPLTEEEKKDVFQLIAIEDENARATEFLEDAVSLMFRHHAVPGSADDTIEKEPFLDRSGVAKWMTQALKTEEGTVSAHDTRVLRTLSEYSLYGSGKILRHDFHKLYLDAIIGEKPIDTSWKRHLAFRKDEINAVWRDLINHGIMSPVEKERQELIAKSQISQATEQNTNTLMDECEIVDWDYSRSADDENRAEHTTASGTKSSHKVVELAPNSKTPLWVQDGEFVFIDEESCIGCMQCVNVSPDSFLMLESGRARTFEQRKTSDVNQAVASCPVSCMHHVTFDELKGYEKARDEGDGRDDHRHLGHKRGHIPLHVAGMDSDVNRQSSWYHTLKERCLTSSQCPQKGCFDCPRYSAPGENPYFKKHKQESNHIRANFFLQRGDIDDLRKTAEI